MTNPINRYSLYCPMGNLFLQPVHRNREISMPLPVSQIICTVYTHTDESGSIQLCQRGSLFGAAMAKGTKLLPKRESYLYDLTAVV